MHLNTNLKALCQGLALVTLITGTSMTNAATVSLTTPSPVSHVYDARYPDVANGNPNSPGVIYFTPGEQISIDLNVSGLGTSALGAYDVDMLFGSPNAISYNGASFGTGFGATLFDDVAQTSDGSFNYLRISQVSLALAADLVASQPDAFTLATLLFTVTGGGGLISVTSGEWRTDSNGNLVQASLLSDENGDPLALSAPVGLAYGFNLRPGPPPVTAVPLPATWLLFSAGLAFVEGTRRFSAKKRTVA